MPKQQVAFLPSRCQVKSFFFTGKQLAISLSSSLLRAMEKWPVKKLWIAISNDFAQFLNPCSSRTTGWILFSMVSIVRLLVCFFSPFVALSNAFSIDSLLWKDRSAAAPLVIFLFEIQCEVHCNKLFAEIL